MSMLLYSINIRIAINVIPYTSEIVSVQAFVSFFIFRKICARIYYVCCNLLKKYSFHIIIAAFLACDHQVVKIRTNNLMYSISCRGEIPCNRKLHSPETCI